MPPSQDIEERMLEVGDALPSVRRRNWFDILTLTVVVLMGTVAIGGTMVAALAPLVAVAVFGLMVVSVSGVYQRMMSRPDHVRALQSDSMLKIASSSIGHLRQGLDAQTAGAVCRIVLHETEAAAVAITDRESVLGFAGVGEDHHKAGGPIITRATMESLETDESRILHTRDDIGCPRKDCLLRAAIVVPLEIRGHPVGTLKFYYVSDRFLNETQLAMAEGLARLLSTQLELAELDRQTDLARDMELKALQAQINPHFLFNTINTIASFIRTDPVEARRLLRRFGTFYRTTLEQADELVTVQKELEYVTTYVELEQARFGERLVLETYVEPAALGHPLPAFMLQPLVENAIGHGMRPDDSTLTVTIRGRIAASALVLEVIDDGVGIAPERLETIYDPVLSKGLGIALRNVRDRLSGLFGPESSFEIRSEQGVGTTVTLRITPLAGTGRGSDASRFATSTAD